MTDTEALQDIEEILQHLEAVSFVAHRDASAALPAVRERFGPVAARDWLDHARDLFFRDREGGKAFIGGTQGAMAATDSLFWMEQAAGILQVPGAHKALEGFMAQVGDAHARLGPEGQRRWVAIGVRWLGRHRDSGVSYFRTPWADLAAGRGVAGIEEVLAPAERLPGERRLPLESYLTGALRVRAMVGLPGLEHWARRGSDILLASRQRGEAFFRLESPESRSLLLEAAPGYRVREHRRLLRLIQAAWLGRAHPVTQSDWLPGDGRPVAETDGHTLFLPAAFPDQREALLAVVHAAGHLELGTYDAGAIRALFEEAGLGPPPLDPDQPITWQPLLAAYGDDRIAFQLLFDQCEDLRVDAALDRRIPGHLRRLAALAEYRGPPEGPAEPYWRLALASVRGAAGQGPLDGRLEPLLGEAAGLVDSFRIANRLLAEESGLPRPGPGDRDAAYLPGRGPHAARAVYPRRAEEAAGSDAPIPGTEPERSGEAAGQGAGRAPDSQSGTECSLSGAGTGGKGTGIGGGAPTAAGQEGAGRQRGIEETGTAYPEWDYREAAYKPGWTRVREKDLAESDPERAEAIRAEYAATLGRLKRALQMQKPRRPAPRRRQLEGEELDVEAATDFVTEKRAGNSPEPFVYKHRARLERDTAVLLLADLSTSIMAAAGTGEGRVVDRLRAGMLLFAEALEELGDPYALAGFASKYRDQVSYYSLKGFGDPLDAGVRAALGGISGRLATRMGAAIRHACHRLGGVTSGRKLLLILSDGRPADYDDGGDPRYLHEDTRMAVKEAVDRGVHPFCLTLDPKGSEYLPAIFGPGHYLVLDRVDDLPRRLPEVYLRLRGA